jgi:hypothetical protein
VAWKVVEATAKGAWKPYWQELFDHIQGSVPPDWFVIVTTDRGLYADWMYKQIQSNGWHPFMRINNGGQFRLPQETHFRPLKSLLTQIGQAWCGTVTCFKTHPIECTLLARWDEGYTDPWLIVTDLEPTQADACWYAMRSWVECLFKDTKRGGFGWHHTKMTNPQRAQRLWLAIALATLWVVSVGGEADANVPASSLTDLPDTHVARQHCSFRSPARWLSCFRRGVLVILSTLLNRQPLPLGRFFPDSWSSSVRFSTPCLLDFSSA